MRESSSDLSPPTHLRAADADRRRVVDALERHYLDGRLTVDELDERLGRALAARSYGDLEAILTDLPSIPARERPRAAGRRASRRGTHDLRPHAVVRYLAVMAVLVLIWALTSPGGYFWPIWPMLGWGIALVMQSMRHGGLKACALGHSVRRYRL